MAASSPAPVIAARFWPLMGAASSRNSPKLAPRRSRALHAIPRASSFSARQIPEKFSPSAPSTNRRAPTSRALSTHSSFPNGDAWIGGALRLRLLKKPAPSHHRDRMRRVWNFLCPPARFVQWKAVIHDGRSGDGVSWVGLAYLPRNVAPIIDGIAVQDSGVRAQANVIIQ